MNYSEGSTVGERLATWQVFQGIGKKKTTLKYHREIVRLVRIHWPDLSADAEGVRSEMIGCFLERISDYSATRYNAAVCLLKAIIPSAADLKMRKVPPKFVSLPDPEMFRVLLGELDSATHTHAGLCARLLVLTGMRIAEAQRLEWRDVSDQGITLRPEVTKNGKGRFVPMIGGLSRVLFDLRAVSDGRHVLPQSEFRKSLASACKRAGIKRLTHHDFRRLFATRVIESGVDLPTAAKWMGHQDGGALLGKTYFHLADAHAREMAGQVEIDV